MKRALIVDDDQTVLKICEQLFKSLGFKVETAGDAHQGLRLLKILRFDLIVTDANMPSLSGFDLLEIIRRGEKNFGSPKIIMLTGRTSKADEDLAIRAGADRFIQKPVDVVKLKETTLELLDLEDINESGGIEVSENVRWANAFQIVRVTEDGVEMTSKVMLNFGQKLELGSKLLVSIAPSYASVEVTACTERSNAGGFLVTAKFDSVAPEDKLRIHEWLKLQRRAA